MAAKKPVVKKTKKPAKKMPAMYKGKSTKPGGGGAFMMMKDALMKKGMNPDEAAAITANAGRKKFGAKKFKAMGIAGKKRAAKKGKK